MTEPPRRKASMRPILRYHGGKFRIAPWVISHFPKHRVYVEPYGGAGSVLMRKERSEFEIYNDLDQDVVNVFRIMRDPEQAKRLADMIRYTPWSRHEFDLSYEEPGPEFEPGALEIERARRTIVRCFMAHGSTSRRRNASGFRGKWHPGRRGGGAGDWPGYPEAIVKFTKRLERVVIEERPATYIIERYDGPGVLFYVDPPYPTSTRTSVRSERDEGRAYLHDMTDDDHRELAALLRKCEAAVVVSGYPCALYDEELYAGWQREEKRAMADGGRVRKEVLWIKPGGVTMPAPQESHVQASML